MIIEKVLVVDDDEDIRLLSELALRRIGGWEVAVASSGEEALERAREQKPDVILLDVMMPRIDGPTTLAMLREEPSTANVPVIFLTAKVQQREVDRYRALGARGVIRKPFRILELPAEIRRIVAGDDAPDAELRYDLERFRASYRRKLPGEFDRLSELLRTARERDENRSLDMARELAHKVKGTAGSYGFDDISAGMQRIEERVDCLLEGSARDSAAVWAEIEHALARARDEVSTG